MTMANQRKKAAALTYLKKKLDIPVISAMGSGEFAEKIIAKAAENGVKIVENEDFFMFQDRFRVGQEIPQEIYTIVVTILTEVLRDYGEKI